MQQSQGMTRRGLMRTGAGAAAAAISLGSPIGAFAQALKEGPVKIGITDWNLQKEMNLEAVGFAKKLGFEGVEVSLGVGTERLPLADPALQQQYVAEAQKHGVAIPSTCLNILHRNYLKNDPLGKRWVADSIPITKALGARVILLPFFGKGQIRQAEEMDFVADFLREVGPEAEKIGVILGLENTNSAEENARILDRAKSKAVLVYYDIGNSFRGGFDVVKEIRWLGRDRICEFHIKDNPNLLGHGKIDLHGVARAIADIGFTGWAHLETGTPRKNLDLDLSHNLGFARAMFPRPLA